MKHWWLRNNTVALDVRSGITLSSQPLCAVGLCYYPCFTDGELRHRDCEMISIRAHSDSVLERELELMSFWFPTLCSFCSATMPWDLEGGEVDILWWVWMVLPPFDLYYRALRDVHPVRSWTGRTFLKFCHDCAKQVPQARDLDGSWAVLF